MSNNISRDSNMFNIETQKSLQEEDDVASQSLQIPRMH